jgi:hypothetical protein
VVAGTIELTPPAPDRSATPEPTDTPSTSETPAGETPVAQPTATPARGNGQLTIDDEPLDSRDGVIWVRLAVNRFSTLIPSEKNGWRVQGASAGAGPVNAPPLVRLSNLDNTSLITLNPRSGDMYWFISVNGVFDEVQMRTTQADGAIVVADPELLRRLYGAAAEIPLFMLENINIEPEPTPTPEATPAEAAP